MKKHFLFYISLAIATTLHAQSFTGTWQNVDDETQKPKGHLEMYQSNGQYFGKATKLLTRPADSKCLKCTGDRYNQPVMGMVLLENMVLKDGLLQGGKILDPENGKWYSCKMWFKTGDPNVLVVRGYLYGFYRTQYWYRVK
jgi:uncharacterized protein (DUF2147 family)